MKQCLYMVSLKHFGKKKDKENSILYHNLYTKREELRLQIEEKHDHQISRLEASKINLIRYYKWDETIGSRYKEMMVYICNPKIPTEDEFYEKLSAFGYDLKKLPESNDDEFVMEAAKIADEIIGVLNTNKYKTKKMQREL